MLAIFLEGLIIGFSIAAPVGPIGILCINRSLQKGYISGFVTGLGAASADGIYGCIAGFGLTFISNFLLAHQFWIRNIGGIFLLYLGVKTFLSKPVKYDNPTIVQRTLLTDYLTTFFLTLTNPMTILSFVAIFASLELFDHSNTYQAAGLLVIGVILGSLCWWLILSSSIAVFFRAWIKEDSLRWINRISGAIISIFGFYTLLNFN